MPKPPAWSAYKVGKPKTSRCVPLTEVTHTAHQQHALNILRDGRLRAGLVYDHCKLNTRRTTVVWLSPNYWAPGFRYGTIQFAYNWTDLIEERHAYWVEAVTRYSPHACRILLTRKEYDLAPYDPTQRDGPWWQSTKTGRHYYNNEYTLEILIDEHLTLTGATRLGFVSHHENYCSNKRRDCPERGMNNITASGRFLSRLITEDLTSAAAPLLTTGNEPTTELHFAWQRLARAITGEYHPEGRITTNNKTAPALARAIISAHARGDNNDVTQLRAFFKTKEDLTKTAQSCIERAFGLPEGALNEGT
jgi:hypothetical protein